MATPPAAAGRAQRLRPGSSSTRAGARARPRTSRGTQAQVGPREAAHDAAACRRAGPGAPGSRRAPPGSRSRCRRAPRPRQVREQLAELQVLRAEVVAPFADAVRLVDRDQRAPRALRAGRGSREARAAPVRRRRASTGPRRCGPCAGGSPPASSVEARNVAATAARVQRLHLVVHQRDQRRDHDAWCRAAAARGAGRSGSCRRRWAPPAAAGRPRAASRWIRALARAERSVSRGAGRSVQIDLACGSGRRAHRAILSRAVRAQVRPRQQRDGSDQSARQALDTRHNRKSG